MESLPSKHEAVGSIPVSPKLDIVVHIYNPTIPEVVEDQKFKVTLGYIVSGQLG